MSSASTFVNPWVVDSRDKRKNRPDGKPFNEDFDQIMDYDQESCVERVMDGGGTEEEGTREWFAQVDASTATQTRAYNLFRLAMMKDAKERLLAHNQAEDDDLKLRKEMAEEMQALKELSRRKAQGETAQMRADQAAAVEAKKKEQADLITLLHNGPQGANQGIQGKSSSSNGSANNLKLYLTIDGLEIMSGIKEATITLAKNMSLYRCFELGRLLKMMDHSGIGWTLDFALQILAEEKMAIEEMIQVPAGDPYYALTFWSVIEGNPGFMDKVVLEKLIRIQFMITDSADLHYLMFHPHGVKRAKVYDRASHTSSLEAIQAIWWIFFGDAWKYALQPLIDRLQMGNLGAIFRVHAHMSLQQDVHCLLTHQIQSLLVK